MFLPRWVVIAFPAVVVDCSGSTLSVAVMVFLLRWVVIASPAAAAMDCSVVALSAAAMALCLHDFASAFLPHWAVSISLLRWAARALLLRSVVSTSPSQFVECLPVAFLQPASNFLFPYTSLFLHLCLVAQ